MQFLHDVPNGGGIFAIGDGVVITDDGENELIGGSSLRSASGDDDQFDLIGTHLELRQKDGVIALHVVLDPDEAKALGEALIESAAEIASGQFEAQVRKNLAEERAER